MNKTAKYNVKHSRQRKEKISVLQKCWQMRKKFKSEMEGGKRLQEHPTIFVGKGCKTSRKRQRLKNKMQCKE